MKGGTEISLKGT